MNNKLISINSLYAGTENRLILDNISLDIYAGEIICLLGQSGSGKTTTANAILNTLPENIKIKSGSILYEGKEYSKNISGSFISAVMQSPASCFDNVFTIASHFKDILKDNNKEYNEEYICKTLEKVELNNPQDILNSYPFQLSGGMLQRVMIAVALCLESKVIIADEPTSDLDVLGQEDIIKLILNLKSENKAVMMITHNLTAAKKTADRIAVMNNGRIVDIFKTSEIYENSRHSYTKELINANKSLFQHNWNIKIGENNVNM